MIPSMKTVIESQIEINILLDAEETNIPEEYMSILMQFGLITFFGTIFPLSGLLCFLLSWIQYLCIRQEFYFKRR